MVLRENPTDEDWYQIWKRHPSTLPGFDQRQSSRVYQDLGLNPQIARWAGQRKFVSIVNKDMPVESQMRIRGDGGSRNANLVREWQQREADETAREARNAAERSELERGKRRRTAVLTDRQGQPGFRNELLDVYGGQCSISGVSTSGVLQAAHIESYDGPATNVVTNGLLLRADLHNLFDAHLLWIEDDLTVRVAESVIDTCYRKWDGHPLRPPNNPAAGPDRKALRDHRLACLS